MSRNDSERRTPVRLRGSAVILATAVLVAGCGGNAGDRRATTAERLATTAGAAQSTVATAGDDATTRSQRPQPYLLATVERRLRRAGIPFDRQPVGFPVEPPKRGQDVVIYVGKVHVWSYLKIANAKQQYALYTDRSKYGADVSLVYRSGRRVYELIRLAEPLSQEQRANFWRIVRIGEGRG